MGILKISCALIVFAFVTCAANGGRDCDATQTEEICRVAVSQQRNDFNQFLDANDAAKTPVRAPRVQIAIFIIEPTPFITEFFENLKKLRYSKSNIDIVIFSKFWGAQAAAVAFTVRDLNDYHSIQLYALNQSNPRNIAVNLCLRNKCNYQLSLDANVQLTNRDTLSNLMKQKKTAIAPFLAYGKTVNFAGNRTFTSQLQKAKTQPEKKVWKVEVFRSAYLIKASVLRKLVASYDKLFSDDPTSDAEEICRKSRANDIPLFVTNEQQFGRLLSTADVEPGRLHDDLWQILANPLDWKSKFVHPEFTLQRAKIAQPCPGVFVFPLLSHQAADALIDVAKENCSLWRTQHRHNYLDPCNVHCDSESCETHLSVSVLFRDLGYLEEWHRMISTYAGKVVERLFPLVAYNAQATEVVWWEAFIARYHPDEQPHLIAHEDESLWTLNIALNSNGEDYEGGGCKFLETGCSVTQQPKGYAMVHSGKVRHEGVPVTKGTRYIAISFVV